MSHLLEYLYEGVFDENMQQMPALESLKKKIFIRVIIYNYKSNQKVKNK